MRRATTVLLVLLFTLLASLPAQARVHRLEVREYSQDFGVSNVEAKSALAVQDRAAEADIGGNLEQELGNRYAGVWFDNKSGEFVVPLVAGARRGSAASTLAADGLRGDFRTVRARSSWDELKAAHERLDRALMPLISSGLVQTSLEPRTNAVVIDEAGGTSTHARARISHQAASAKVTVEIRHDGAGDLVAERSSCFFESKVCGYPLRGGVTIVGGDGTGHCTAGFKAIGNTYGNRFMLTAGHCATTWPNFFSFDANDPGPNGFTEKKIGFTQANDYPAGDWAAINANGSEWDGNPWPSEVAFWGVDNERTINYESSSYMGEYVCHSGAWTGSSCGYVSGLDLTVQFNDGTTTYHMTRFDQICSHGGDSGGPVFFDHTALGIFSGASAGEEECPKTGYYNEITEADAQLGVTVGTGAGAPPYAETWDADNSFGTQVTGHGKVDPNGMPTTWRFEYGTTSSYGSATESYYAGTGMGPTNVSATISGLQPGTTYHYRISSSNGLGQSNGEDKTFKANGYRYMLGTSTGTTIGSWNSVLGEMSRPVKMGVGDFTGDKKADIVAVESGAEGKVRYMLGTSNGSGIASWSTLIGGVNEPKKMAMGDVNGDGKADIVVVESDAKGTYRYTLGTSTGTGMTYSFPLTGMSLPTFMRLGDVNGDGKADVVSVESEGNGEYRYMLGISTGTSFSWGFTSLVHMSGPWSVALGDVTGDKKADIVAVEDAGGGSFRYMIGTSTGTNFTWGYLLTGMAAPYALELGDVNGDGKADIVADESEGGVNYRYMFGLSTGGSIWPWGYALTGLRVQEAVGVGDVTGDGKADVIGVEAY